MSTQSSDNTGKRQLLPNVSQLQNDVNTTLSEIPAISQQIAELEVIINSLTNIDDTNSEIDTTNVARILQGVHSYNQAARTLSSGFEGRVHKIQELLKENPVLATISEQLKSAPIDFAKTSININVSPKTLEAVNQLNNNQSADAYQNFVQTLSADTNPATQWAVEQIKSIQDDTQLSGTEKQNKIKAVSNALLNQQEAAKLLIECKDISTILSSNGKDIPENSTLDETTIGLVQQLNENFDVYMNAQKRLKQFADNPRENHLIKEMLQTAATQNNEALKDLAIALAASTVEGQEYSPNALVRIYNDIQKLSPDVSTKPFDTFTRKDLVDWAIQNTSDENEKAFLTKLRDEYDCDFTAYLKKQAPTASNQDGNDIAAQWTKIMHDAAFEDAGTQFFTYIQNHRLGRPQENTTLRRKRSTSSSRSGSSAQTLPHETDSSRGAAPSTGASDRGSSTSSPETGTDDETDSDDTTNSDDETNSNTTSETESTSDTSRRTTHGPSTSSASIASNPLSNNAGTNSNGNNRTSTSSLPSQQADSTTQSSNKSNSSQTPSPTVQPQKNISTQPKTASLNTSSTEQPLAPEQEQALVAMQANEDQKKEEGNWWSRNWTWILGVIGILATAGLAYFFIRKYKKDADKSKTESANLQTKITDLKNQVNDLTKEQPIEEKEEIISNPIIESTLAKNSTPLKTTDTNALQVASKNSSNAIG